jgi:hypothetical protein
VTTIQEKELIVSSRFGNSFDGAIEETAEEHAPIRHPSKARVHLRCDPPNLVRSGVLTIHTSQ